VLSRIFAKVRSLSSAKAAEPRKCVENLERRVLFHVAHITNVIADNRGEVILQMDHDMDPTTVNSRTVFMHVSGADGTFGTADDVKILGKVRYFTGNKRITFRTSALPANQSYSFKINAKRIRTNDGSLIDGDFNGAGKTSGNGVAGGDFLCITKKVTSAPTARFSTEIGAFNVGLFDAQTPKNVSNFIAYANGAAWDGSFLHRSIPGFIVQGGGFNVNKDNQIGQVGENAPVDNEPGVSNTRGTIALARPDDSNPATDDKGSNQWFFNLADNGANLDNQNGGFTAFGKVTTDAGLAVVDALAGFPILHAGGVFNDLPVKSANVTTQQVGADPAGTLILIRRVAILNKVVPYVFPT
jgi:cyclophilin family peptidyl-prolyl cis-trans isomerase